MQENSRDTTDIRSKLIKVLMSNINTTKEVSELVEALGVRLNITLNSNRSTHSSLPPSLKIQS